MEYTDIKNMPGILLFVDFEKAFDTIEWSFISKTLEVFKFACNFKKMFSVIYNNVQSSVMNGGRMTNYFEVTRGVWQGCQLSPSLFIPTVEKMFSVTYNNVQSSVMNGGRMTNYFEVTRGVWQGCQLSPSLFILTVELLALKIHQSPNCRGIRLPNNKEARISRFADDTTIVTNSKDSLKSHLQTLDVFEAISGLKLNRKKTKGMWSGSMKYNTCKIL